MDFTEAAPAKINLALHVRRRRADGYHDLDTLFAFTAFGDTLAGEAADGLSLTVEGPFAAGLGGNDDLVAGAARALAAAAGCSANARLHLTKRIPVAAGLGGGSADAAAALRLLNRIWGLGWPDDRLVAVARTVGADVAACITSRTSRGTGRGDTLQPWPGDWDGMAVLLVNVGSAVPTGPVFAGWDGVDRGGIDPAMPLVALRNDLTKPAIACAPTIATCLDALTEAGGATLVRMSGSGATCFALYDGPPARDAAAARLGLRGWWMAPTHLRWDYRD